MIKTLLKTLLLLAAIGYLVFAIVKVSRPADELVCTGVEYIFTDSVGNMLVDQSSVELLLGKHKIAPKGKTLGEIDIRDIERLLSESPYIDTVTCYHTASGKLCIRIQPKHALLHVYAQNGDEFYVGEAGDIMPAGDLSCDLPIVTGDVSRKYASTRLIQLGTFLRDDPYWSRQAQQIHITPKGEVEIIPGISDQRILLGEPKNIADKLERVRLFYEKGMPKTGWNKYNTVNAAYKGQIIWTKK